MAQPIQKSTISAMIAMGLLTGLIVAAKTAGIGRFFGSKYLYEDDVIFVGANYFRISTIYPDTQSAYYTLIETFVHGAGIAGGKSLLYLMPVVTGLLIFKILRHFSRSLIWPMFLSLLIIAYPVAPDQSFFLTGAHPTAGLTVFAIIALLYVDFLRGRTYWSDRKKFLYFLAICVTFFVLSKSSPVFSLVPLLSVPIGLHAAWSDRGSFGWPHIMYLLPPIAMTTSILFGLGGYHYEGHVGWTDFSASRIFSNVWKSFGHIFERPFSSRPTLAVLSGSLFIFIAVSLLGLLLSDPEQKMKSVLKQTPFLVPFLIFLFLAAALVYGPGSVTTNFRERYTIAPFQIMGLLAGVLTVIIIQQVRESNPIARASTIAVVSLGFATVWQSYQIQNQLLTPFLDTHDMVASKLGERAWREDDQILVLLPEDARESTAGYNHWSSWYLRVVTDTPGLIGLIGSSNRNTDLQAQGLFVDTYSDHDPIYWSIYNGTSVRRRMIGLERARATYTYAPNGSELELLPLALSWPGGYKRLLPGQRFDDAPQKSDNTSSRCPETAGLRTLRVAIPLPDGAVQSTHIANPIPENTSPDPLIDGGFKANGMNDINIEITDDQSGYVSVHFELMGEKGQAGSPYNETYPPMPVLTPGFGIYLIGGQYHIMERHGGKKTFKTDIDSGGNTQIDIVDCGPGQSANALYLNGELAGYFSSDVIYGNWRLGAGYLQRHWVGEIPYMEIRMPD